MKETGNSEREPESYQENAGWSTSSPKEFENRSNSPQKDTLEGIIDDISKLPLNWHGAGSVNPIVLKAILHHVMDAGPIRHSIETGSGKTTLLFSHLSSNHTVFAVDDGQSITQVRNSSLFNSENVTFVEGPTQKTLPHHAFSEKVQVALIDGPHGYPFPDLEYYYFYPLIETNGLLLVDDIQIPTIRRMFEIIQAGEMFELLEIAGDDMAIFRRTEAPLIDPKSDSWWLQGYNKTHYNEIQSRKTRLRQLTPYQHLGKIAPDFLKNLIPEKLKRALGKK